MSNQIYNFLIEPEYQKYYSSDSDYGVYSANIIECLDDIDYEFRISKDDLIIINGNMPKLQIGKRYNISCEEVNHPKFGKQYKIQSIYSPQSSGKDEEQDFLRTIVTDIQFNNIVELYPAPITSITDGSFDYTKVKGIGKKSFETIQQKVQSNFHLMKALSVLGKFGITYNQVKNIVEVYNSSDVAIEKVMNDPYTLYRDIRGVGFIKADNIAQSIGIAFDDPKRIKAGLMYSMELEEGKGNTWAYLDDIKSSAEALLELDIDDVYSFIDSNYFYLSEDKQIIALGKTRRCEENIAKHLKRINNFKIDNIFPENQIDAFISQIESNLNIEYTDKQKELFHKVNTEKITVLTGYAGTGKTSSLNGLLNMLDRTHYSYILASPTAKAAKVLNRATGRDASTIHRALRWTPTGFAHTHENPLQCDLVIIDEVSMVDIYLMRSLLDAIKDGCRVLFVGDPAQLESVSTGNILNDMIESEVFSVIKLDLVFRQALDSGIINAATQVRQGQKFFTNGDKTIELGVNKDLKCWFGTKEDSAPRAITIFNKCIKKYSIEDVMVVSPMKNGASGVKNLNNLLQEIYNPQEHNKNQIDLKRCIFREGDRVIHTKNLYEEEWLNSDLEPTGRCGVFNGDTGIIKCIDMNKKIIYADYGDKIIAYHKGLWDTLELSYCITCHKAQGSSSKVVIMVIDTSHYMNLKRSLIYTAMTRASELLFLIADKRALSIAIDNNVVERKRTFLKNLLDNSN